MGLPSTLHDAYAADAYAPAERQGRFKCVGKADRRVQLTNARRSLGSAAGNTAIGRTLRRVPSDRIGADPTRQ